MNAHMNRYGLALAAIMVFGLLGAIANAAGTGFYVHVNQNVSVETGIYYTITAQAQNLTTSYAPSYPTQLWSYQWYNTTAGQVTTISGANSRTLSGIAGSPGIYTYEVVAKNLQKGYSISNTSTLNVAMVPSIYLYVNKVTLDQNQTFQFKSAYAPGAGNASYIWNISKLTLASGCLYPLNTTCTISTSNVVAGTYNVSLFVIDGTEHRYITTPVSAQVVVNQAPSVTIAANDLAKVNETLSVTVLNGTGPFNVNVYRSNGILIGSGTIQNQGVAWVLSLPKPKVTTSYYATANDLGVKGTYSFNSPVSTIVVPTPAGSAANPYLIAIIVLLVMIILAVYAYNSGRHSAMNSNNSRSYETVPAPDDEAPAADTADDTYETQSKLDSDKDEAETASADDAEKESAEDGEAEAEETSDAEEDASSTADDEEPQPSKTERKSPTRKSSRSTKKK